MDDVRRVRVAEREALVARVVEVLRADRRLVGAWLFGSLGRGTADEWSDVDLCVVVRDDALGEVVAARHEMVNSVGEALLEQDVPQNEPPGGAFRLAYYVAQDGMQEVDWTWRAYTGARPPVGVKVLFGAEELAAAPAVGRSGKNLDERDPVKGRELFFWAMCPVAAKYVARGAQESAAKMLGMVTEAQRWVRERTGAAAFTAGEARESATGKELLDALRQQCLGMEALLPQLKIEELSPAGRMDRRFLKELYGTFDLVESTL